MKVVQRQLICIAKKFCNYPAILACERIRRYEVLLLFYVLLVLISCSASLRVHFIRSANKLAKCFKAADKVIRKFYRLRFRENTIRLENVLVGVKYNNGSDARVRDQDNLCDKIREMEAIN